MSEYVDMDPEQVSSGAAQWSSAAAALNTQWQSAVSAIEALNGAQPWGGDRAGAAFRSAYAPEQTFAAGDTVIAEVQQLGSRVAQAAQLSAAADEEQAAQMNVSITGI